MLVKFAKQRLTPGLLDLVPRLLTRVQIDAERPFRNGSYLIPVVRRYDGHDIRGEEGDKPALFVNFPFFALKPVRPTFPGEHKPEAHSTDVATMALSSAVHRGSRLGPSYHTPLPRRHRGLLRGDDPHGDPAFSWLRDKGTARSSAMGRNLEQR